MKYVRFLVSQSSDNGMGWMGFLTSVSVLRNLYVSLLDFTIV